MKLIRFNLFTLFIIGLAACNQNTKTNTTGSEKKDTVAATDTKLSFLNEREKCFMAFVGKDSAFLSLIKNGEIISGDLIYQFSEKDNTKGNLNGTLNGDTLNLDYTFQSEGITSKRPLKFLIAKDRIIEIYGSAKDKEGKGFIYNSSDCKTR